MSAPTFLQNNEAFWLPLMNMVIEAVSCNGHNDQGQRLYDNTTARSYRCYIVQNTSMAWRDQGTTEGMPYTAYLLSVPIGQTMPAPILDEDKLTVTQPANTIPIRRFGRVMQSFDQIGNLHNMQINFE